MSGRLLDLTAFIANAIVGWAIVGAILYPILRREFRDGD